MRDACCCSVIRGATCNWSRAPSKPTNPLPQPPCELKEESGIAPARVLRDLGCWSAGHRGQVWSFHLCSTGLALPEHWSHQTEDDNGHVFDFFWAPLDRLPFDECHPLFQRALREVLVRLEDARPSR